MMSIRCYGAGSPTSQTISHKRKHNTTDELLQSILSTQQAILSELQRMNGVTPTEPQEPAVEASTGRWKPKNGEKYGYVNIGIENMFYRIDWSPQAVHRERYALGNCYRPDQEELAIWEQVTRRAYDQQLRDAADYFRSNKTYCHYAGWCRDNKEIIAIPLYSSREWGRLPLFCFKETCIEAHTRILGDDAERYFTDKR